MPKPWDPYADSCSYSTLWISPPLFSPPLLPPSSPPQAQKTFLFKYSHNRCRNSSLESLSFFIPIALGNIFTLSGFFCDSNENNFSFIFDISFAFFVNLCVAPFSLVVTSLFFTPSFFLQSHVLVCYTFYLHSLFCFAFRFFNYSCFPAFFFVYSFLLAPGVFCCTFRSAHCFIFLLLYHYTVWHWCSVLAFSLLVCFHVIPVLLYSVVLSFNGFFGCIVRSFVPILLQSYNDFSIPFTFGSLYLQTAPSISRPFMPDCD